jgi:hypothetical protein
MSERIIKGKMNDFENDNAVTYIQFGTHGKVILYRHKSVTGHKSNMVLQLESQDALTQLTVEAFMRLVLKYGLDIITHNIDMKESRISTKSSSVTENMLDFDIIP